MHCLNADAGVADWKTPDGCAARCVGSRALLWEWLITTSRRLSSTTTLPKCRSGPLWGICSLQRCKRISCAIGIGLGVVAGLGMLTKYSIAVLLLTLGLYLLGSAQYRKVLLRPGPWLAVCLMALIFAPHMLWLKASQWLPFAYASGRALSETGYPRLEALGFPLTQLAAHLPSLGVLGMGMVAQPPRIARRCRRLESVVGMLPVLLCCCS